MHKSGIIHRDLKIENILINKINDFDYDVKVADFGLAIKLSDAGAQSLNICGSPTYIAPEILKGLGYGLECDIFSLGSIFFNLITGAYLFKGNDLAELLYNNKICDLTKVKSVHYSSAA